MIEQAKEKKSIFLRFMQKKLLTKAKKPVYIVSIECATVLWPVGRVVMQRTANPSISVRFRYRPPQHIIPA